MSFSVSPPSPDCLLSLSDLSMVDCSWLALKYSVLEEILILLFKLKQGLPDSVKTV